MIKLNVWKTLELMSKQRFNRGHGWMLISVDLGVDGIYQCRGGTRPPSLAHGKNKGQPNWKRFDKKSAISFAFTEEEVNEWIEQNMALIKAEME